MSRKERNEQKGRREGKRKREERRKGRHGEWKNIYLNTFIKNMSYVQEL